MEPNSCSSDFVRERAGPLLVSILLALVCVLPNGAHGLTFNFNATPGTDQQAIDGFAAAGLRWAAFLQDDITINIDIAFTDIPSSTGATILGSASSEIFEPPPDEMIVPNFLRLKTALKDDATTTSDYTAATHLPEGVSALTAVTNLRDGMLVLDNNNSGNNTFFRINTGNAKALSLMPAHDPGVDASITFNNTIAFDFDPSNGITPGHQDFVGVATHEIGHAMGFTSGVDLVDAFTGNGPNANLDLNGFLNGNGDLEPFALFSTIDLYKRSSTSIAAGPDVFDLSTNTGVFFSVDGQPSTIFMETGSFNGTGRQASHFLDNIGLGIMDPTAAAGELLQITTNDLLVMDIIGYNLVLAEGDLNTDSAVDGADLAIWQEGFGTTGDAQLRTGDADGDNDTDGGDLLAWQRGFGSASLLPAASAAATSQSVPEPSSAVLAALLLVACGEWKRREQRT